MLNSRSAVSVVAALSEGFELSLPVDAAEPLLETVVQSVPPGAADGGDPGRSRRRLPVPAGETGAGDGSLPSRVKLFRWTPSKGSLPAGGTQ